MSSLVVCLAAPAAGQTVAGSLRSSSDSQPVAGALVLLGDSAGHEVARTATADRGTFLFQPRQGGRYQVRVLRIGMRPEPPRIVDVPAHGRIELTIVVHDEPVVLEGILVAAERRRCGIPPDSSALGMFLAEARKALALTAIAVGRHEMRFEAATWLRQLRPSLVTMDSTPTYLPVLDWPVQSAPPDSLRAWGFVHDEPDSSGSTAPAYYGPDERVLFADWFLADHCLRAGEARDPGQVALDFTPSVHDQRVDIAGSFVFDSATFALQELNFHWFGLPTWVPPETAGGFIRFRRLDSGEWLPVAWSIRAPVPLITPSGLRLSRYLEKGGVVTRILTSRP